MKTRSLVKVTVAILGVSVLVSLPLAAQDDAPKKLYIPNNPRAAAYILGRLSNKELLAAPKVEPVFIAILERKGLDAKYREDALQGLVDLHKSDRVSELLTALQRLDAQESAPALSDVGLLLVKSKAVDLIAKKTELEALVGKAQKSATRQVAYAGLITAVGKADTAWELAAKDNAHLADLIGGLPRVADGDLRAQFQSKVAPLAKEAPTPEIRQAAIKALPSLKGNEAQNFGLLAGLVQSGTERGLAVRAILQLPRGAWQKDQAGAVARSIVAYAAKVPADQRTEQDFLDAVQLGNDLSLMLPAEEGKPIRKTLGELGVRVMVLKTLVEQMFFDKTRLVVEAGKPVQIIYENPDAMPHNLVITAPGAREEVGQLADKMPPEADEQGRTFVPKSPKVLFATKLVEPEQRIKLDFTAPTEPGEYTYVCTFPGHWVRMFGSLVVVKDVEEYLAKNPEGDAPKITEWKIADFDADIKRIDEHRSFDSGKQLFNTLGCVQCHQLGKEGAVFGPNLTGVFGRWKNDPRSVLQQILEPSLVIDPKYRNTALDLGDENSVNGIVLAEDTDTVTIQAGPSAALIQKVKKADIKSRRVQENSLMPAGLLSLLNKEQILDLLAYVKAEGNPESPAFHHH